MADILGAVTEVALPIVTGNFEVTIGSLGWTPKMVKVEVGRGVTNGAAKTDVEWSVGYCDGDSEWVVSAVAQNALGSTSNVAQRFTTDETIQCQTDGGAGIAIEASGVGDGAGSNPGPISDGWRFNVGAEGTGSARIAKVTFFGGADLKVNVGSATATGTTANTITMAAGSGDGQFSSDLIFTGSANRPTLDTADPANSISLGIVDVGNSTQVAVHHGERNDRATSMVYGATYSSRAWIHAYSDSISFLASINNITSTGFDVTATVSPSGKYLGYACLNVGGGDAWAGQIDTPTSAASDWSVTAPNFTPVLVGMMGNYITGVDALKTDSTAGAMAAMGFDGTREYSVGLSSEDGQSTTDTQNLCHDRALYYADGAGTVVFDGQSPTLESTGWKFTAANLTTVDGTARKMIAWAIGAGAAAAGGIRNPMGGPTVLRNPLGMQ